jgi:hypothetical protein
MRLYQIRLPDHLHLEVLFDTVLPMHVEAKVLLLAILGYLVGLVD